MSPHDPNLNALWCRCIGEELLRAGVRDVVLAPGNRNVPLAFAFQRVPGLRLIPHVDERSGAFIALGLCRAAGRPVAICTTSGSAVANCLPALAEAWHQHLPLLLISADRPPRLHGCEAPQTMQQVGIFRDFLEAELDLPLPAGDTGSLIELRQDVHAWAARCAGPGGGPGQLNVPLDDPLPPLPDPGFQPPRDEGLLPRPATAAEPTATQPRIAEPALRGLRPGLRGLIIAGPQCPLPPEQVASLAARSGFPLLADACSSLRRAEMPNLVSCADALVAGALRTAEAELLIRLGPAPVARPLYEFCARHRGPVLRLDRYRIERDFCHRDFELLVRPAAHELERIGRTLEPGDPDWCAQWLQADAAARTARERALAALDWGEVLAAATICEADYELLQVANSMAVRHANLHLHAGRAREVIAHRGLNGIDGTLGSFIGALLARPERPGLLFCGDLAFLHDLPALSAAALPELRGTICVLDNGGGAIFDLLPVGDLPGYRQLIRTPRPLDRGQLAAAFGLPYRRCENRKQLATALAELRDQPGLKLVEAVVPPDSLLRQQRQLLEAMSGARA